MSEAEPIKSIGGEVMAQGSTLAVVLGNLVRDVDLRTTQNGTNVGSFTLAVSKKLKDSEHTSFLDCVAWGKTGEVIAQYTKKGDRLYVSGELSQRSYEDKNGNKRSVVEVVVRDFTFLGGKERDETPRDNAPEDIDDKPISLESIPF